MNYQRHTESKSILIVLLLDFVMIIQKDEEMNYRELWWWIIKKLWYCIRAWGHTFNRIQLVLSNKQGTAKQFILWFKSYFFLEYRLRTVNNGLPWYIFVDVNRNKVTVTEKCFWMLRMIGATDSPMALDLI